MKHIKMMIYGEPGAGKSVFALNSPKPFFITTDGNYEWLEDFGAKPEDHQQVYSWEEAKKAFNKDYSNYDTIIIDLLEDLFKWCEQEYCIKSKLDHVSDVGYGKGYDITRNEFFLEISKLLGKPKNVILISHGVTFTTKDRRGVEHTKYAPSNRIPDKVLDMIEGRLRYCLRCYMKGEETSDGKIEKKRYLSLVPKENEFGIIRGVNENQIPQDINLDWNEFTKAIGFNQSEIKEESVVKVQKEIIEKEEVVKEEKSETNIVYNLQDNEAEKITEEKIEEEKEIVEKVEEEIKPIKENVIDPVKEEKVEDNKNIKEDKLAAIKAKLAAIRQGK